MNKDVLLELFNQACIGLPAFLDDYMDEEFPEDEVTVTIPFVESASANETDLPSTQELASTHGFETLTTICEQMENTVLSAMILALNDDPHAKTPFMMAVRFHSVDAIALRDKIQNVADNGLFDQVRAHYGL